jgi:hypothetical protein
MLMVLPVQLSAQQGGKIKFGNFSLIPGIDLQGVYDDNIYTGNGKEYASPVVTRQERKESDWVSHVKPSLFLDYLMPGERGYARLGYQGDYAFYDKNTNNNWKNSSGLLDVDYRAPGGLILGIKDTYTNAEDPLGNADQYAIGRVTKRWTNTLGTKLGYHVATNFRTILYYNNTKQAYKDVNDFSQDYTDNEYGIGVETRLMPKTWGFLRYHYGQRKYDTLGPTQTTDAFNSDSKRSRVSAGVGWDPGGKLSGEINVGYEWLKYDHEFANAAGTSSRADANNWVAATSVSYEATATTTLGMSISRSVHTTASDTSDQFVTTGIGVTVSQKLLAKLTLTGGLNYSKSEYRLPLGSPRTDDNYLANVGLGYAIQDWVSVGVGYNFIRNNSTIETEDYTENQCMVWVKVAY